MVPGVPHGRAPAAAQEHLFCACVLVRDTWLYIREMVVRHQPELQEEEDRSIVRFLETGWTRRCCENKASLVETNSCSPQSGEDWQID